MTAARTPLLALVGLFVGCNTEVCDSQDLSIPVGTYRTDASEGGLASALVSIDEASVTIEYDAGTGERITVVYAIGERLE